jgi:predicted lipoprotein with Yx(FWY)xxD motif
MKTVSNSKRTPTVLLLGVVALVVALAIAGCGGGDSDSSAESRGYGGGGDETTGGDVTAAPNPEEGATFVSVASVDGLGQLLVDSSGRTLYEFDKDKGTTSSCYGACAEGWPPLITAGEPHASNGADGTMLGTTKRKDGSEQVTYNGRPLYTFVGDKGPGEANGNDVEAFGAEWYALTPSGSEPEDGGERETPPPPTSY